MLEITLFGTALIATIAGIALFRRYGGAVAALDVPNDRSSHTAPTLRGAGIVIVAVCVLLYLAIPLAGIGRVHAGFVAGALVVAGVSWVDDAVSLPPWIRFLAHSTAAIILLGASGTVSYLYLPGIGVTSIPPAISYGVMFLWIVWMINAYNFMDGIDGIAGAQAVAAGIGWAAFSFLFGDQSSYLFSGILVFSALGFLVHNWNPARVFMGDVGSSFFGYTFAALPLLTDGTGADGGPWLLAATVTFVWLFVFDTVFTLTRRLAKGERVWLAHRQHLYQRLVITGWSHSNASLLYAGGALLTVGMFIAAFTVGGIAVPLLVLIYVAVPAAIAFLAFRKKV